jgi:hypothetical protein
MLHVLLPYYQSQFPTVEQWGDSLEGTMLTLPLSASLLSIVGMHEGTTKQVVSYNLINGKWVGQDTGNALWYIAICK